jgi:murein L,D-transpeptidase YafK
MATAKTLISVFLLSSLLSLSSLGQTSFVGYQKSSLKVADIFNKNEDSVKKIFTSKGIHWPAKYLFIRSFKFDRQLEVWAKNELNDPYVLIKQYRICMQSGTIGPKRLQGDYQVPEGIYQINEFRPASMYHLSLGLNYPNASDKILSDAERPGGEIFIHGSCVSVGCIPLTDEDIEELYIITSYAQANGLDFIPVHIFPIRYNVKRSAEYLSNVTKNNEALGKFENRLKDIFEYFNEKKQLPLVLVNKKGEYVVN